ncbi:MAG: multiheme c-type cytochrome [Chitinophagaceae bacterium]
MPHIKIMFVLAFLTSIAALFIKCSGGVNTSSDPRGKYYAGSAACMTCHKGVADSYIHSSHNKTSGLVSTGEMGSFLSSANRSFRYDDSSSVTAEKLGMDFYQTWHHAGQPNRSEQMQLTIGSGEKAQSYANWKDGQLMQLPLTYLSENNSWTNSPGFPVSSPYFKRPILSRCLECHASYASKQEIPSGPMQVIEKIDPSSIIYGIDCERCHGPSIDHVRFHEEYPDEKKSRFITSINTLTRQQKVDLCASCHSGNDMDMQREIFGFRPGDTLANYIIPSFGNARNEPDVHGKQMQLLAASKCYRASQMTCQSCHDSHGPSPESQSVFVTKCMACHDKSSHATSLKNNAAACINCHMPLQASKKLEFKSGSGSLLYMLRTHRIAVYNDSSHVMSAR